MRAWEVLVAALLLPWRGEPASGAEILVKFKPGASASEIRAAHAGARAAEGRRSALTRWRAAAIPPGADLGAALRRFLRHPAVEAAEIVLPRRIGAVPNDLRSVQWPLHNTGQAVDLCCRKLACEPCDAASAGGGAAGSPDADVDAPEAWDLAVGSTAVIVAVLDTGIDLARADLAERLVPGYDFVNDDDAPDDDNGHGTAVAGIIGAVGNNGAEMTGLNWSVSLMPLKVCDAAGACESSDLIAALEHAAAHGAGVVNMSLGCDEHHDPNSPSSRVCGQSHPGACFSQAERDVIEAAVAAGVVAVEAAANCGSSNDDATTTYPCAYDLRGNVCTGATTMTDDVASFSNFGPDVVDIGAPGDQVPVYLRSVPGGIALLGGTSFAAPMTAGVAALLLSRTPLTPEAVGERIVAGGDRTPAAGAAFTGGRLNAFATLADVFLPGVLYGGDPPGDVNLLADVNGDGRADLVRGTDGSGFEVSLNVRKKRSFGPARSASSVPPSPIVLAADVTGDRRDDLLLLDSSGCRVLAAGKKGRFKAGRIWSAAAPGALNLAGDLDGDGRSDLLRYDGAFSALLSTGRGFRDPAGWGADAAGSFAALGDVDGDGRDDLIGGSIVPAGVDVRVSHSTGGGFGPSAVWITMPSFELLGAADFDGDGLDDLLARDAASGCLRVSLSTGTSFGADRAWTCPSPADVVLAARLGRNADRRVDLISHAAASGGWLLLESRR